MFKQLYARPIQFVEWRANKLIEHDIDGSRNSLVNSGRESLKTVV